MSALLKTSIESELSKCKNDSQIDQVFLRYRIGFTNAVDASEFSHMVTNTRMRVSHENN